MSQGLPNKHTQDQGAWTFCGRCGDRVPLKDLKWQRGKLLDAKCYDNLLIGDIDKARATYMSTIVENPDLQPDPKLTEPTLDANNDDIFI